MGSRKLSSKLRRSALQLKYMQEMTESSRSSPASLHMHFALLVLQPDDAMQPSTHDVNSKVVAPTGLAAHRRRHVPTTASLICLVKTIASALKDESLVGDRDG
jgi:hypothetical protein